jgi:sulfur carrier protein
MTDALLHLVLNGEPRTFPRPLDIAGLLQAEGLGQRRVAVEVNGAILPRGRHAGHALADGDRVEIVHALGGG